MNLDNIVIVLSRPEEPRNIGAACRAMANNGIHKLRIVGKKEEIDLDKVHVLAIHASYIFDNAEYFSSITEACSDCVCSCGTTRRRGKKRKGKLLLPEEFAKTANRISGTEKKGGKVAVVFGNERTGLDDNEILECEMGVTIPSSEEFGSLNLSHAVQIMCYTLFRYNEKKQNRLHTNRFKKAEKNCNNNRRQSSENRIFLCYRTQGHGNFLARYFVPLGIKRRRSAIYRKNIRQSGRTF